MVVTLVLASCSLLPEARPGARLVVATWNVQNLFDEVDDGTEYPDFDPGRGWTRAQFWARCEALARVIRGLGGSGPDLLVLQEVEGAHALEVLRTRFLADLGYRHVFLAPPELPGVKTAILSRFAFLRTGLHVPGGDDGGPALRPLVEVEVDLGGRPLVLLGNHWKSRIPTPQATEHLRREAARLLAARVAALEARPDHPFVIAAGDFNTSLELSRPWPDRALAGVGSDLPPGAALTVAERPPAGRASVPGEVWDPWDTVTTPPGSYFFQGRWDRLDHIFVASSSLRLRDWGVESFLAEAYAPRPLAYQPRSRDGVSDHFPLVLTLTRRSP